MMAGQCQIGLLSLSEVEAENGNVGLGPESGNPCPSAPIPTPFASFQRSNVQEPFTVLQIADKLQITRRWATQLPPIKTHLTGCRPSPESGGLLCPKPPHIHVYKYIRVPPASSYPLSKIRRRRRRRSSFAITLRNSSSSTTSMALAQIPILFLQLLFLFSGAFSATFTIVNKCSYPVWPGILSNAGTAQLPTTGFALQPDESNSLSIPTAWSGRLWGRTLCSADSSGKFTCITGDCGSGTLECSGGGAAPPATLAEFTLNGADGLDFYDVSLVDGYNLPMVVAPQGGTGGNCTITGCVADLNAACPSELKVSSSEGGEGSESVACKSACDAFGDAQYCCSGAYATPDTCKPSSYSEYFKSACPRAYSYAYDDGSSTFTCASADYTITFCYSPATRYDL